MNGIQWLREFHVQKEFLTREERTFHRFQKSLCFSSLYSFPLLSCRMFYHRMRNFNARDFCRMDGHPSHRNFDPRDSSCTSYNWSTDCDNYYWGPLPNGLQPPLGIHRQNILSWIVRSNQLRNRVDLLPRRMDYYRKVYHNTSSWSIQDGSAFQLHLNSRLWFCCCTCCKKVQWIFRNNTRNKVVLSPQRIQCLVMDDDIERSRIRSDRDTKSVPMR